MANWVIKKQIPQADGTQGFFDVEGVFGKIRLWEVGNPPVPTDYYILIGDFSPMVGKNIKLSDRTLMNTEMEKIFTKIKGSITNYSVAKRRAFNMDIKIPKVIIDSYKEL